MDRDSDSRDFIKFVGTAGARVVLSKQLRSSGGMWVRLGGKNIYLDPGPGALVRCWDSRPPLDPSKLDAIILTHRHLDHSGDLNAMVEAMAEGGFKPHGKVFAPEDALEGPEPILFQYLRNYPEEIYTAAGGGKFFLDDITVEFPLRHWHPVETYGVKLLHGKKSIAFISDTRYFPELIDAYKTDIIIINMTFVNLFHGAYAFHLSGEELTPLITGIRPKQAIITHFGRRVIDEGPEKIARKLEEETGIPVLAAADGMEYVIPE